MDEINNFLKEHDLTVSKLEKMSTSDASEIEIVFFQTLFDLTAEVISFP
jgi:hypothetical protein